MTRAIGQSHLTLPRSELRILFNSLGFEEDANNLLFLSPTPLMKFF